MEGVVKDSVEDRLDDVMGVGRENAVEIWVGVLLRTGRATCCIYKILTLVPVLNVCFKMQV